VDRCGRFTIWRHAPALAPAKDRKQIRELRPHGAPFGVKRVPVVQLLWRRPQRCMNKSATSSLLGASATRLTRFANHAQTRTMRAQQSVTMIDTMGLRVKAQTPAAQRMARKSFPLAPSCRRGRRQPSKGSGQSRMPHIAARPAPLQRPATSPDAPLRKGSKLA